MTRVSSFGLTQTLLSDLQRNQNRVADGQVRINSGKKTDSYQGISRQVETLLGAKSLRTRSFNYLDVIAEVKGRFEFNDLHLGSMDSEMEVLRMHILSAIAVDQTAGFSEVLEQALTSIINSLNAKVGGVYLFGGTRTDVAPVTISTVAELEAAANAAAVFQNSQTKSAVRVDESVTMEFGLLADEIATPLLDVIRDLAVFNSGAGGPIDGKLTAAQRTFLEGMLAQLDTATDQFDQFITINGVRMNRLDAVEERVTSNITFLTGFISDIEDVDIVEAILNLNADQAALQASYSSLATLFDVSLLDFI